MFKFNPNKYNLKLAKVLNFVIWFDYAVTNDPLTDLSNDNWLGFIL